MNRWVVIVPTCPGREEVYNEFVDSWNPLFVKHGAHLITMYDGNNPPPYLRGEVLSWDDMDGEAFPIKHVPRKSDMVRSYAIAYAYRNRSDNFFLTLDDDVRPCKDVFEEYEKVFNSGAVLSEYFSVGSLTDSGLQMRGFPFADRKTKPVAVQYGGWSGVLDYDAVTQLAINPDGNHSFEPVVIPVPRGTPATCCIMNCAWKREYAPIMWQLPLLNGEYNRWGDIWSGLIVKKTLDAVGAVMVINGKASVRHERASNPFSNLVKEYPGVGPNEVLWNLLEDPPEDQPLNESYDAVMSSVINAFSTIHPQYCEHLKEAYKEWSRLMFS